MNGLPILAVLWLLMSLFYLFSLGCYAAKLKFHKNMFESLHPLLNYDDRLKNILTMIGATIVMGVCGVVLFSGAWWVLGVVAVLHGNEVYRGAVTYMRMGKYWESIKHQIIHTFVLGYMGMYVLNVKLGGVAQKWVVDTLSFFGK